MIRKIYIYPLSIIFGIFLYYILFSSNFITTDYSFGNPQNCVEIVNYSIGDTLKEYKYPFSCDQDFYYKTVFGNLKNNSLKDIWYSNEHMVSIDKHMSEMCTKCQKSKV